MIQRAMLSGLFRNRELRAYCVAVNWRNIAIALLYSATLVLSANRFSTIV
jgi:hypothetical protein